MTPDLSKLLANVAKVRLRGGIAGKVTLAVMVISVAMCAVAIPLGVVWVSVFAIAAAFLLALALLWRLMNFADKHPEAAILDGAEFLTHERMKLATKDRPVIDLEEPPIESQSNVPLPPPERIPIPDAAPKELKDKMTGHFYHLYVRLKSGKTRADLETVLEPSLDWIRYEEGLYILHSSSNESVWYQRLEPLVKTGGYLLIYRLDAPHRKGYMSKTVWDWLSAKVPVDNS